MEDQWNLSKVDFVDVGNVGGEGDYESRVIYRDIGLTVRVFGCVVGFLIFVYYTPKSPSKVFV